MKRGLVCAMLVLMGWMGCAANFTGEWTTRLTFAGGSMQPSSTLTLNLGLPGWEFSSTWSLAGSISSTLAFQGAVGPLGLRAGASFLLIPGSRGAVYERGALVGWSAEGLKFTGAFLSLEMVLGNLTLRVTFVQGCGE